MFANNDLHFRVIFQLNKMANFDEDDISEDTKKALEM